MLGKQFDMKQRTKVVFLSMLLGTLGASLLENLLGKGVIRACEGTIKVEQAGQDF